VGYHQEPRQVNMQLWNWRGLDVINAHERDPALYLSGLKRAVAAVCEGKLRPWALFTHDFSLTELDHALATVQQRPEGFLKALVHTGR
jgi:threonine dehydrogenase-like Zn-dependent dehydrogenase